MKVISEAGIKTLGGKQGFARGLKYYNQGRVGELILNGTTIVATVSGGSDYLVTLHHTARQFEGSCECPASDRFDFCHHCVATALAYYYKTQTNQEISEKRGEDRVSAYLETLTKPELVKELANLIDQNPNTKDVWILKAEIASGGLSPAEIRKRITKAIPYKASGLWRFKEVADYFKQASSNLSLLVNAIQIQSPNSAIKLATYAIQRLEKTLKTIDDSNGYRDDTQALLMGLFNEIINNEHWELKGKVHFLTNLVLDPDFNYDFLNLPYAQLNAIGQDGFDDICKTVEKAWQLLDLPEDRYSDDYYYYVRLEQLLVEQAQDKNDQNKELQILERAALHIERCLELVYLCIDYKQTERAQSWLDFSTQLKRLSVNEIHDVETAQIALWLACGESEPATNALWTRFDESESRRDLDKLLKVVQDDDVIWLDRAIKLLGSRIEPNDKQAKTQQRAETLACIYIDHSQVEEAKQLHKVFPLRSEVLLYLAEHAAPSVSTLYLIEEGINKQLQGAYQNVYTDAIDTLEKHYHVCPSGLLDAFHEMVLRIYDLPVNKRKTNFIKLLKASFTHLF